MTGTESTYDLIVGLGRSGLSMAKFLVSLGRTVKATDIDPSTAASAQDLEALGVETHIGYHEQALFDNAARIIPSPGIPLTIPYIQNAAKKGVEIAGELDIFAEHSTTPVIAVTGTNGKTTTTTLIGEMLRTCGKTCFVGGNIGTPLVDYLTDTPDADWVVAEVSSFQLDLARSFSPKIGLLLNVTEDHLDRYPSFDAYADSKWSLFARQTEADHAVINLDMAGTEDRISSLGSRLAGFSAKKGRTAAARITQQALDITLKTISGQIAANALSRLPGAHNRENIAAAALAVLLAGGRLEDIIKALEAFTPLPHRMTLVREVDGVRYYNDSKATNVDAVIRALESFETDTVLILGGREKDTDFTPLIAAAAPHVKQILAIGEARGHIIETFEKRCQVVSCASMAKAVETAAASACPGDVVLLSPACASFDMYKNYEARGDDFTACVAALKSKKEAAHG